MPATDAASTLLGQVTKIKTTSMKHLFDIHLEMRCSLLAADGHTLYDWRLCKWPVSCWLGGNKYLKKSMYGEGIGNNRSNWVVVWTLSPCVSRTLWIWKCLQWGFCHLTMHDQIECAWSAPHSLCRTLWTCMVQPFSWCWIVCYYIRQLPQQHLKSHKMQQISPITRQHEMDFVIMEMNSLWEGGLIVLCWLKALGDLPYFSMNGPLHNVSWLDLHSLTANLQAQWSIDDCKLLWWQNMPAAASAVHLWRDCSPQKTHWRDCTTRSSQTSSRANRCFFISLGIMQVPSCAIEVSAQ